MQQVFRFQFKRSQNRRTLQEKNIFVMLQDVSLQCFVSNYLCVSVNVSLENVCEVVRGLKWFKLDL